MELEKDRDVEHGESARSASGRATTGERSATCSRSSLHERLTVKGLGPGADVRGQGVGAVRVEVGVTGSGLEPAPTGLRGCTQDRCIS